MLKIALANLLTAKIAAATAALAAGGIAVAAAAGGLPAQHDSTVPKTTQIVVSTSTTIWVPSAGADNKSASPSPSLKGLCQAYTSGAGDRGKALDNPAFTALVTAAGGKDKVAAYCDDVLTDKKDKSPGKPTR